MLVTGAGSGRSAWDGLALTAWSGDRTEDADGFWLYLRDLDDGAVWSVGHQPVRAPATRYEASPRPGVVELVRLDRGIEARLEIAVAPDADVEVRRLRLRNHSAVARRLTVTSYVEVVLHDPAGFAAHPGFAKLFVETEYVAEAEALLARRRPRSATDRVAWMVHALSGAGSVEWETDRVRFLGRNRGAGAPHALGTSVPLSGTVGSVLDPVLSLRRTVTLAPGDTRELCVLLGAAPSRAEALALVSHATPAAAEAALAQAADRERELRRRLGVSAEEAEEFQELAGAVLYAHPALRAAAAVVRRSRPRPLSAPPGPVADVVGRGEAPSRELLRARPYWRAQGFEPRMLLLCDHPDALGEVPDAGVVTCRAADLPLHELDRLLACARAVLTGPPRLDEVESARPAERFRPAVPTTIPPPAGPPLLFDAGYGGFTPDGSEYVIRLDPSRTPPPLPWINVVANERFGFLVSESGAAHTWSRNSRENRLTPWTNDPVSDPYGEALYVRDEDAGVFWSPLPGPVPTGAVHEVRHGFGYTRFRQVSHELEQEVVVFVPRDDPLKVVSLRLTNRSDRPRRLSVFAYFRLVLGGLPTESGRTVVTDVDPIAAALLARNPQNGEFADGVVFLGAVPAEATFTADRTTFLGRNGSPARPAAVAAAATLDGRTGEGLDPCAAAQSVLTLAPGESRACAFLLGEATDEAAVGGLLARYRAPGALERALDDVRASWRAILSAVEIETPSRALDVMVNGWLLYQTLACRVWGRTAFYQASGAFGFRDQLQDSAALVYARPDLTRAQILLHAAHQFVEGDVLHWWHPPTDRGTRTRFSDDLLWLPYVTTFYVGATGDERVLDERVGFVTARRLEPGEDEAYLLPSRATETADLYEHCCRALDRSLTRGAHGLPLMGTGDWNDGMNRVGREGRGESVWLGFFLHVVLEQFVPFCERRGETARARRYREYRAGLAAALEDAGWDGAWYRRAYYDDGTPLGSAENTECRIDALVQAWAVISGVAPPGRAAQAMDAVERELVLDQPGMIRLLTPPFDRTPHDPGYIKGYVPGIRENGGQYTHAACWVVRALAELGRRERATALLEKLGPVHHTRTGEALGVYQVEPYVVVADIYGVAPHLGRGGWTWYTGSAGWMYRVALESILGVTLERGTTLRVKPCIPDAWPGFRVRLQVGSRGTRYEVEVVNRAPWHGGGAGVVTSVEAESGSVVDGTARIPLRDDGGTHHVRVMLATAS